MPLSNRHIFISLLENQNIKKEKIEQALHEAEIIPSSVAWYNFIDKLLLWFGGLALAFAMMFFIAYNWTAFGRFGKFALVEGAMVLSVGLYWYLGGEKLSGKVTLMFSSILLGVLLALVGQTYQTGADSWQLFFYWAILMLPWAVVGRFSALWLLWISLINLSIFLYMKIFGGIFGFSLYYETSTLWILFIFNTLAWVSWAFFSLRYRWLNRAWAIRLLGLASMMGITWLMLSFLWEEGGSPLTLLVWLVWLGVVYGVYRVHHVDLFMLALISLSFSIVVVNFFITVVRWEHFNLGSVLFIGLLIIGLGAGSASWLKSVQKEAEDAR